MNLSDFPALNACLNGTSAVLLAVGFVFIKQGKKTAHRNCMIAALVTSTVFLACYLYYHAHAGTTKFVNPPGFKPYYIALLLSHTVLAVVIVPLIFMTFLRAIRENYELHRKIARWTWPLWMYVSVTGVLVYLILYQIYPQTPVGK
jgi:putative membrane protein